MQKPKVFGMKEWEIFPDDAIPGSFMVYMRRIVGLGRVGCYFMPPGTQTTPESTATFSLEEEDDGTADEWYGPCNEFYYVLVGEFTLYWGKDVSKIKAGTSEKLVIKAGEFGHWTPGWKYAVKNTGNIPGTFFWGITSPPKGTKTRHAFFEEL